MMLAAAFLVAQGFAFPIYDAPISGYWSHTTQLLGFFTSAKIRQELAVTPDQFEKIKKIIGDVVEWHEGEAGTTNLTLDRDFTMLDQNLVWSLSEGQKERLAQLWLQWHGIFAIEYPSIGQALHLTRAQEHKIFDVAMDYREQVKPMAAEADAPVNKFDADLWQKTRERLTAVLTPEQEKEFKHLQGKPFDWKQQRGWPLALP